MKQHWKTRAACTATAFLTSQAQAGRPLQTEDAGVLERFDCELEGANQRLRLASASSQEAGLTVNCGLGLNSQVGLSISRLRVNSNSGNNSNSSTGAGLGGKTSLWKGTGEDAPALTLAWGLGYEHEPSHWRHQERFATLVSSIKAGPGTVHLNLGHVRSRAENRRLTGWNLAYEHANFDLGPLKLAPMAEMYGNDRGNARWNLALRATLVPDRAYLDVSWGRQLQTDKARLLTAGFKLAF